MRVSVLVAGNATTAFTQMAIYRAHYVVARKKVEQPIRSAAFEAAVLVVEKVIA